MCLPTEKLRQANSQERPIDSLSVVADFTNAQLNGDVDPKAFQFEVPTGAEIVQFLVPPDIAQLLGKPVPNFKFVDLAGKPVTPASLAGKVAVVDFWATWCGPCRQSLPNLQKVYEQYKKNPKVAFYAVSVDRPKITNSEVAKTFEELKVDVPIVRETNLRGDIFKTQGAIPSTFIIDAKGIVQDCESGANPRLAEVLPEKLDKLLAGRNIYEALHKGVPGATRFPAAVRGIGRNELSEEPLPGLEPAAKQGSTAA